MTKLSQSRSRSAATGRELVLPFGHRFGDGFWFRANQPRLVADKFDGSVCVCPNQTHKSGQNPVGQ